MLTAVCVLVLALLWGAARWDVDHPPAYTSPWGILYPGDTGPPPALSRDGR